jgi:hypothetical protein
MKLIITDKQTLKDASGCLHDATITPNEVQYDAEAGTVKAVFNRLMWETSKRQGIFRPMKMQVVHCRLTIRQVLSYNAEWKMEPEMLSAIRFKRDAITFEFIMYSSLQVKVQAIDAELEDMDEPWDDPNPPYTSWFGKD